MKTLVLTIFLVLGALLGFSTEPLVEHYENGQVKFRLSEVDGKIYEERFYQDGTKYQEGYRNGQTKEMIGTWYMWHDNGTLIREANFRNGMRHGEFKVWNYNGDLVTVAVYKKNIVQDYYIWTPHEGLLVSN